MTGWGQATIELSRSVIKLDVVLFQVGGTVLHDILKRHIIALVWPKIKLLKCTKCLHFTGAVAYL